MTWIGTWRNQNDSLLEITADADGRIVGWFRTALEDSPFSGADATVTGAHKGDAIGVVFAASRANVVASFAGTLRDGRIEALWFLANGEADPWRSMLTNHDTFTKLL